ncbi:MAG: ATP-dependent DNA helicase RecG [Patescibacteria group bacterium]
MITLETELVRIRGIAPAFLAKLEKLKIKTVKDLLWHFPYRYDDFSKIVKIGTLQVSQAATVSGTIHKIEARRTWRRRMVVIEALVADETGGIKAVWFNQPYITRVLRPGMSVNFAGKVLSNDGEAYLSNPAYEPLGGASETKHTAGLIPIYSETRGLTSKGLRYLVKPLLRVLPPIQDFIPKNILSAYNLPELDIALKQIHFPALLAEAEQAKRRFAFEDLFLLQLNNLKLKQKLTQSKSYPIKWADSEIKEIVSLLPFELTNSQNRSMGEILADIAKPVPMNRLLQGDVGSGKTVIAAIAAMLAARSGEQTAFMAPTEVLARQHFKTFEKIFRSYINSGIKIGLLLSGLTNKEKKQTVEKTASGEIKILVGTHALIQKSVEFKNLGLVIVDEQHRFGVKQRAALTGGKIVSSGAKLPHFLSMSATPIPRTLSLTLFGDLDISIIDELPKGRKPIVTKVVAPENRARAYEFIRAQIKFGRQAFVICPKIEEAANDQELTDGAKPPLNNKWSDVKAVKAEYEKLSKKTFPDLKVAMMHGKLPARGGSPPDGRAGASGGKSKSEVMREFAEGKIDILVSTSVVEVGVDVPNASIMLIEGADRFGLAQLYQFRGRVGRGEHQSFVFLFTDSSSDSTKRRLDALLKAKNGFELAEQDLAIRGPGQFLGDKQTGLPDLAMRSLNNMALVKSARESAVEIIKKDPELNNYPNLEEKLSVFQKEIHLE